MRIEFRCPCRQKISVKGSWAGRAINCPKCQKKVVVPAKSTLRPLEKNTAESDLLSGEVLTGTSDKDDSLFEDDDLLDKDLETSGGSRWNSPNHLSPKQTKKQPAKTIFRQPEADQLSVMGICAGIVSVFFGLFQLVLFGFSVLLIISSIVAINNFYGHGMGGFHFPDVERNLWVFFAFRSFIGVWNLVFAGILIASGIGLLISKPFGWRLSVVSISLAGCSLFACMIRALIVIIYAHSDSVRFRSAFVEPDYTGLFWPIFYGVLYAGLILILCILVFSQSTKKYYLNG